MDDSECTTKVLQWLFDNDPGEMPWWGAISEGGNEAVTGMDDGSVWACRKTGGRSSAGVCRPDHGCVMQMGNGTCGNVKETKGEGKIIKGLT